MQKLYDLKEMLCEELKEYGSKNKLDVGALEIVDKLAHAVKNIDKIIESYDGEGYSEEGGSYEGGSYARGGRGGRRGGANQYGSYARGGGSYRGGSYARGMYSNAADNMISELKELMQDAPDEHTKREFHKFIQKIEQM